MDKQKTGELIRNARIKKGYTQVELGDLIGVTNKAISRWEKGESFPDISVIEELSACPLNEYHPHTSIYPAAMQDTPLEMNFLFFTLS